MTQHKIGHFGYILPSQSLGTVLKKLNLTQKSKQHKNKCVSRLARCKSHHTALVDTAAPSSEPRCTTTPMSPLDNQQMCSSAGTQQQRGIPFIPKLGGASQR